MFFSKIVKFQMRFNNVVSVPSRGLCSFPVLDQLYDKEILSFRPLTGFMFFSGDKVGYEIMDPSFRPLTGFMFFSIKLN